MENLFEKIVIACNEGKQRKAFEYLQQEWHSLDEPKVKNGMLPRVIEHCLYICDFFHLDEVANKLGYVYYASNILMRKDIGTEEFELGKMYYSLGSLEIAKELFSISNKLFGGKRFKSESRSDYKELVESKIEIQEGQTLRGRFQYYLSSAKLTEDEVQSFNILFMKWEKLKYPKMAKKAAYEIVSELIQLCINCDLFEFGNECAPLLLTRFTAYPDNGEREFLVSRLAYKQGNLCVAQLFLNASNLKSDGKSLEGEQDANFAHLINQPSIDLEVTTTKRDTEDESKRNTVNFANNEKCDNETKIPDVTYKMICELYDEGETMHGAEAIKLYNKAISLLPGDATKWEINILLNTAIGDELLLLENFQEALQYYNNAYNSGAESNPYVLFKIGSCKYEIGDLVEAKEYFIRTYMLDGDELFKEEDSKYYEIIKNYI